MKYSSYKKYKDSGVEWLEEIPSHWEIKKLKFIADVNVSNVDKKSYENQESVRLVNYTDVYYNEAINTSMNLMEATASAEEIKNFSLSVEDVIITKDSESANDIGIPSIILETEENFLCGYHLSIIRADKQNSKGGFLLRCFQSKFLANQFEVLAKGVTRVGISKPGTQSVWVPVPPIEEQVIISDLLSTEIERIDTLIDKRKHL